MKRNVFTVFLGVLITLSFGFASTNTGAVWLLIAPGARAEAMGEAHVAIADDAYASYYNPAGLSFMNSNQIGVMYSKWLPNLVNDMFYTFMTGGFHVPNVGTFGGHAIYLNLGEQQHTDEYGNPLGTFFSYMMAVNASYSTKIRENSAFGVNMKFVHQMLSPNQVGVGAEQGNGSSFHFGFDIGYQARNLLNNYLDLGIAVSNIGPKISFVDVAQADPQPTNLKMGMNIKILQQEHNKLSFVFDINKILAGSHPSMDANGNYIIERGNPLQTSHGEEAYTDHWFVGMFTSFTDSWFYRGDIDQSGDGLIGGYDENGSPQGWHNADGDLIDYVRVPNGEAYWVNTNTEQIVDGPGGYNTSGQEVGWGEYGHNANQFSDPFSEVGSQANGSIKNELNELILNTGIEYVYNNMFALRAGFIYDRQGDVMNPTIGFGFIYRGLGFDFAYTSGKEGHPLANTMRYSVRYEF